MFQIIQIFVDKNATHSVGTGGPGPHLLGRVESLRFQPSLVTLIMAVVILLFLIAILLKEQSFIAQITFLCPTSGLLIILGMISAFCTDFFEEYFQNHFRPVLVTANIFQHVLIFPVLLYTSYSLYSQQFLRQVMSVLILSVIGTLLNVLLSGILLKYIYNTISPSYMDITQCMVFASLISVVDPLAVVTVFRGVNEFQCNFFLPFGAALFGYGVAMELFEAASTLAEFGQDDPIPMSSFLYLAASILTDPILGIIIGVTCGLISAAITKITSTCEGTCGSTCEYFEPLVTLGFALFGYVLCLNLGLSYIFATIACGLVQQRYTFINMSPKSSMSTENIVYALSLISELLMFVLVGDLVVPLGYFAIWDYAVVVIIIIYIIRIFVTLLLSLLINIFRLSTISFRWQLLIFGGHRGPMSFAMALAYTGPYGMLFRETTLLVIVFSVMVDGVMSRYIASQLKLRTEVRPSAIKDLLIMTSIYGGGELGNLLGVKIVANRNNYCRAFERMFFRFFITDEHKLAHAYRMHSKERRRLAFKELDKHSSYQKHERRRIEVVDEDDDAFEMEAVSVSGN